MPAPLPPSDWDPTAAGGRVLASLRNICLPTVKGAHDSDFLLHDGNAYIVYMANDVQPGEAPNWPFVYTALSIVNLASGQVEQTVTFAASEMAYANAALPAGACFVPRIIQQDARTLRCFFASEDPGARESQTWYRDYDLTRGTFLETIHPVELATDQGVFPMQPQYLHRHAAAKGFRGAPVMHGLYMIDGFKRFDGQVYAVLNNFAGGQNAWATLNGEMDRLTVLGDYFLPNEAKLTESAVERLPDGTWAAISRQENRDGNYMFTHSRDGLTWSEHVYREEIRNGTNSKPTFNRFGELYYLGWQEATRVNGAFRSVFNLDVSPDGAHWTRMYRFATEQSFQYPTFREYDGTIYLTVTQGDTSDGRKERIMFGRLC
ncbi:MAG TPA: sialidase family protein [Armatimonadota bacterium]|nr:sialidase family protein [Armatimonadota bacterium]